MHLRANEVPESVGHLLALAERWNVGDDVEREQAVSSTTTSELAALVSAVDEAPDDLWEWLAGPASFDEPPTPEYVAFTLLTMAADSARLKLGRS